MANLDKLWEGYLADNLSETEVRQFLTVIEKSGEELEERVGKMLKSQAYKEFDLKKEERLFQQILKREKDSKLRIFKSKVLYFRKFAAAMIIAGLLFGGYYFFAKSREKSNVDHSIANADRLPGTQSAFLTLSDGNKIKLDSNIKGTISKQGISSVINSKGSIAYLANPEKSGGITYNTLTTLRGNQYRLELTDGTKVWLNASSSIRFPTSFTGSERTVEITGEAYFEVAHIEKIPFYVKSGNQITEDIGTAFNINAYLDEAAIQTTLVEGAIRVKWEEQTELLKPGEQTQASEKGLRLNTDVNMDYILAWKNGEIGISHGDVRKLFREISRWYDVDVEFKGPVPAGVFSASLKRDLPLSNLLNVLSAYGIHTKLIGNKIIVE